MDNIIEFLFEKIFDQLKLDFKKISFDTICKRTFHNEHIHTLISLKTTKNVDKIRVYLRDVKMQERFIFKKTERKLYSNIILDLEIDKRSEIDRTSVEIAVINNKFNVIDYLLEKIVVKDLDYLLSLAEEKMYFYLKEKLDLIPNLSVYHHAIVSNSIRMVRDCDEEVKITDKLIETSFSDGSNEIIEFISENEVKNEYYSYVILNGDVEFLKKLDKIKFEDSFYYSGVLSGSIEMVKYLETKLTDIHQDFKLDSSKIKGSNIIVDEITYSMKGKTYFAHVMNYAVQSKSLLMVKYIRKKGYGISCSNILNCIIKGCTDILQYLIEQTDFVFPSAYIYYLGINAYSPDKMKIALMVLPRIKTESKTLEDFKTDTIHLDMIKNNDYLCEDYNSIDYDFLLKYNTLFAPKKGFKINYRLISLARIYIHYGMKKELINLMKTTKNADQQYIIDMIYLFGTHDLLKGELPSKQIILELMCYGSFAKLSHIFRNEFDSLYLNLAYMIGDANLIQLVKKFSTDKVEFKYVLESNCPRFIEDHLHLIESKEIDQTTFNKIALLDDKQLNLKIKEFDLTKINTNLERFDIFDFD